MIDFTGISIVMATYNGEQFLKAQLDSILAQTHPADEIVIVDDYSSDNTRLILQSYTQKHSHIRLYQNDHNQGVVATFERALSLATGDYIALSDQDDIWHENKLAIMLEHIGDYWLLHSDARVISADGRLLAPSYFALSKDPSLDLFQDYLLSNNVTGCCTMISRQLLEQALPFPKDIYMHDYYLALMAAYYHKIAYLPRALIDYRQHGANAVGAQRGDYHSFRVTSLKKANMFAALLDSNYFNSEAMALELMRDYRYALAKGHWQSRFSKWKLLKMPKGSKLLVLYLFIGGFLGKKLSKWFYQMIFKAKV